MQDLTKGTVRVLVGPTVFSPTAQDQPIRFVMKGDKPFEACEREEAVEKAAIAVEGMYLQLLNPVKGSNAQDGKQPGQGRHDTTPELDVGRKVNIPGPVMFSLWPGQTAKRIEGHTLRSNQYLLVRVYNEEEALANWSKAVIKKAESGEDTDTDAVVTGRAPADLSVGKHYIIRGTEVSFYIPPTGVSVVQDEHGEYVREAMTLERLEYSILVNENGKKRYEKGPAVVFPEPTEAFMRGPKGDKKFRAIELNEIQGIYVKVIADYEEGGQSFTAGQELFITGKDTPIYYPREEHSLIRYDNKTKHFATAIPLGTGRYLMHRLSGVINIVEGPAMTLPDPRVEVFVHRVLTDRECQLWYPGNQEALEYNRAIRHLQGGTATTRGAISEGDLKKATRGRSRGMERKGLTAAAVDGFGDAQAGNSAAQSFVADEFSRASSYTQPRSVTLNTKFQGAPIVNVFTGYAVMVVVANGDRRVVEGPQRILVGYDETLETLNLSTGTPKTDERVVSTVYLRVKNNKVSDLVTVETADHVKVDLRLSFHVDFEGDKSKWFEVENYVKFLTDRVRSVLAGATKQETIANFYLNAVPFVRNTILGTRSEEDGRTGLSFAENGMRIRDVEVLDISIQDRSISELLLQEQHAVVSENIQLERERRKLGFTQEHQQIQRKIAIENYQTAHHSNELAAQRAASDLALIITKIENEVVQYEARIKSNEAQVAADKILQDGGLASQRASAEQRLWLVGQENEERIKTLMGEAEAVLKKTERFAPEFTAALTHLSNNETMAKVSEALSAQMLFGGNDVVDVLSKTFTGIPVMEKFMKKVGVEASAPKNGSGSRRSPSAPAS
jgi:major vault protein